MTLDQSLTVGSALAVLAIAVLLVLLPLLVSPSTGERDGAATRDADRGVARPQDGAAAAGGVLTASARIPHVLRLERNSCGCPHCSHCRLLRARGQHFVDGRYVTVN